MNVLVFDTETTGVLPKDGDPNKMPRICQIAMLLYNTELDFVLAETTFIIDPQIAIPADATKVHGISNEIAAKAPCPSNMVESMFEMMAYEADLVVGHNIEFDLELAKLCFPTAYIMLADTPVFDTMAESTNLVKIPLTEKQLKAKDYFEKIGQPLGDYKNPTLQETYQHFFGKEFDSAHSALADVRACLAVYQKLTASTLF